MTKSTVLIIENQEEIRAAVKSNLQRENIHVLEAVSGHDGLKVAVRAVPGLILLEDMLPDENGWEICRQLKQHGDTRQIPVIMLTDGDPVHQTSDADGYLSKPVCPKELVSRVKAAFRRKAVAPMLAPDDVITIYDLVIHPGRHEVKIKGQSVNLSATEFRLLHFLARRPGWVFTRDQIVDGVHGEDYPVTERTVDVQLVGLRRKLKSAGIYIETVRGIGYRFSDQ